MNSLGQVIGVNTATIASAQGLCFAVSSNLAAFVAGKLIMEGRVKRAYLGIAGQLVNLTGRMIAANKLDKQTGVYVFEIVPDQPVHEPLEAARPAGQTSDLSRGWSGFSEQASPGIYNNEIKTGDIIVSFNGHAVGTVDELHQQLNAEVIGRSMLMDVLREGHKKTLRVVPGEMK